MPKRSRQQKPNEPDTRNQQLLVKRPCTNKNAFIVDPKQRDKRFHQRLLYIFRKLTRLGKQTGCSHVYMAQYKDTIYYMGNNPELIQLVRACFIPMELEPIECTPVQESGNIPRVNAVEGEQSTLVDPPIQLNQSSQLGWQPSISLLPPLIAIPELDEQGSQQSSFADKPSFFTEKQLSSQTGSTRVCHQNDMDFFFHSNHSTAGDSW